MKGLIVEDDPNKASEVRMFLESNGISLVEVARSFQSGMKALFEDSFDIVLLDMQLPSFDIDVESDGYRFRKFAGIEILKELKRKAKHVNVIVITQFETFGELNLDDIRRELVSLSFEGYLGTIYYSPAESKWKDELKNFLINITN